MTNTWFVMIPPAYKDKTDAEKKRVDFRISYPAGSKAWADANAGRVVPGSEGGQGNPQVSEDMVKWKGPFATEDQAKTAQDPTQQSPNPINDAVNAAENSSPLGTIAATVVRLGEAIVDARMWRSLGWLVLGILLVFVGVRLWVGQSFVGAAKAVPGLPGKIMKAV